MPLLLSIDISSATGAGGSGWRDFRRLLAGVVGSGDVSDSSIRVAGIGSTGVGERSRAGGEGRAGAGGAYDGVVDISPSSTGARCCGAGVAGSLRILETAGVRAAAGAGEGAGRLELEAPVDPLWGDLITPGLRGTKACDESEATELSPGFDGPAS